LKTFIDGNGEALEVTQTTVCTED